MGHLPFPLHVLRDMARSEEGEKHGLALGEQSALGYSLRQCLENCGFMLEGLYTTEQSEDLKVPGKTLW